VIGSECICGHGAWDAKEGSSWLDDNYDVRKAGVLGFSFLVYLLESGGGDEQGMAWHGMIWLP
jgi:hypothetical protein